MICTTFWVGPSKSLEITEVRRFPLGMNVCKPSAWLCSRTLTEPNNLHYYHLSSSCIIRPLYISVSRLKNAETFTVCSLRGGGHVSHLL